MAIRPPLAEPAGHGESNSLRIGTATDQAPAPGNTPRPPEAATRAVVSGEATHDTMGSHDPMDGGAATDAVNGMLLAMEDMPAQPTVALRVVWIADDPRTDAGRLADAASLDPVLAARLLRLANSAFYGLRSRVSSVPRAVAVLGFSTVRALATVDAAGVRAGTPLPDDFWIHSALTANAASILAPRFGLTAEDGFSLGLLHDLGEALMSRADARAWRRVEEERGNHCDLGPERRYFGITHDEAAARVLDAWRFPYEFADAIGHHHDPATSNATPSRACLAAAQMVVALAGDLDMGFPVERVEGELSALGIEGETRARMIEQVQTEGEALAEALAAG